MRRTGFYLLALAIPLLSTSCGSSQSLTSAGTDEMGCALMLRPNADARVEARVYRLTPHQAQRLARQWGQWGYGSKDIVPLGSEELSDLLPVLESARLERIPASDAAPGSPAQLTTGAGSSDSAGSRVSVAPTRHRNRWLATVAYQETGTTLDGKRMVRRSESQLPLSAPIGILSVENGQVIVVGVGTATRFFPGHGKSVQVADL